MSLLDFHWGEAEWTARDLYETTGPGVWERMLRAIVPAALVNRDPGDETDHREAA